MYKCKECGKKSKAVNHNGRGYHCLYCWSMDVTEVKLTDAQLKAKAKADLKAKTGMEVSTEVE